MNTTYSQQIDAIKSSVLGMDLDSPRRKALNDAASTIASLNMTKDVPKQSDRIKELEEALKGILETFEENKHQMWMNDPEWKTIEKAKSLLTNK